MKTMEINELEHHYKIDNLTQNLIYKATKIRYDSCLTQKEFAEKTNIKQLIISKIESFNAIPRLDVFISYLNGLGYKLQIVEDKENDNL